MKKITIIVSGILTISAIAVAVILVYNLKATPAEVESQFTQASVPLAGLQLPEKEEEPKVVTKTVYVDKPVEVIKEVEVPVEKVVTKTVTKTVPVEVIKEVKVPVEVIKEVPGETKTVYKDKEVPVPVIPVDYEQLKRDNEQLKKNYDEVVASRDTLKSTIEEYMEIIADLQAQNNQLKDELDDANNRIEELSHPAAPDLPQPEGI